VRQLLLKKKIVVGDVLDGVVKFTKDYGAFIDVGRGVTGLLHRDFMSKEPIASPSQVLAVRAVGSAGDACMHIAAHRRTSCACWELNSCDTVSQLRMHAATLDRREGHGLHAQGTQEGEDVHAIPALHAGFSAPDDCFGDCIGQVSYTAVFPVSGGSVGMRNSLPVVCCLSCQV
jgi:hypothetical protein